MSRLGRSALNRPRLFRSGLDVQAVTGTVAVTLDAFTSTASGGLLFSPFPSVIIEIAFASNTYATSPVWTDVSAYAMEVSIDRGRGTQLEQFNAGRATVKFKNLDGRFNPGNTAGAYYPNVLPNKQVRIRETVNGNMFYGFIEPQGWDLSWSAPRYGEATMRAEDGLARLARYQLTQVADGSYQHDTTGTRVGRVLDDAGWPAAWRDIDTGIATLQGTNFANELALAHLQAVRP